MTNTIIVQILPLLALRAREERVLSVRPYSIQGEAIHLGLLCLFLECGNFPPLCFACFSVGNQRKKSGGKARTPKKGKAQSAAFQFTSTTFRRFPTLTTPRPTRQPARRNTEAGSGAAAGRSRSSRLNCLRP